MIKKTYEEINAKIRAGKAVVVTAEEVISMARERVLRRRQPALMSLPLAPSDLCALPELF